MKETVRKNPYEGKESGWAVWLVRLFLMAILLVVCVVASLFLYVRWLGSAQPDAPWVGGAANLNPVRRVYLQTYLAARADELSQPLGQAGPRVEFVVEPGQSASAIAQNLTQIGLLGDATLFLNYLRYHGLDSQLEAGAYQIDPAWTIPDVSLALTQSFGQEVELRFLEGWRTEEMAAYLDVVNAAEIQGQEFRQIAQRRAPFDLAPYQFAAGLPPNATLEGFLFPDTYRLPRDARAADLVDLMLRTFEERVTVDLRSAIIQNGLDLYEGVTLASIVEREAPLSEERPHVASVFYNRLALDMPLQADPTVQYAIGFDETTNTWWKSRLTQADLQLPSPFNTYVHAGLPPAPIANPGLSALEAVAYPASGNALYFVADCEQPGAHIFSETYEQHLSHVQRCRQE